MAKFYEQQPDGSLTPVTLPAHVAEEGAVYEVLRTPVPLPAHVAEEVAVYEVLRARGLSFEEIKYLLERRTVGTVR